MLTIDEVQERGIAMPLHDRESAEGRVVQVRFSRDGRVYTYRVPWPVKVGTRAVVMTPVGPSLVKVHALGRGDYLGPLKTALPLGGRAEAGS